jgi:tripartite-type tricarboxylate transporter receptor subunit TctC
MRGLRFLLMVLIFFVVGVISVPVHAVAASAGGGAAAFYRGKVVEFVVPYSPGGGYDTAARMLTPFLAKHLGATVIVRNEPGAGGKLALNRLVKENNGLSLVMMATRAAATGQVFGDAGVKFDLTKFNWLGTMSRDEYPVVMSKISGYKSISDIQNAKEVKFAADTKTSGKAIRPSVMGYILGVNVKVVAGYKGSSEEVLALLKGEVDGLSTTLLTLLPYINSQDVVPIVGMARKRFKLLPNVPTIFEAKKMSAKEKRIADIGIALDAIGRPVATTPGVSKEKVAFLEAALKKTLEEPELLKRVEKLGETIDYASGKETAEAIDQMLSIKGEEKTLFGKLLGVEGY